MASFTQVTTDQTTTPQADLPSTTEIGCTFLESMAEIENSVFQVVLNSPEGVELGTAFHVGDALYLTAAHVVADHTDVRLRNAVADFPGTVVAIETVNDVALLRGAEASGAALELGASADLRSGQPAAAVGYPLFEEYRASITGGLISRLTADPVLGLLIQTDAPINRGSSGGPLVDQCGRVIGMIILKWFEEGVSGVAWAVTTPSLVAILTGFADARPGTSSTAALRTASPSPLPAEPSSPSVQPQIFLSEVRGKLENYQERIDAAARYSVSGNTDTDALAQSLWQLAEGADRYRNTLGSDDYDLVDFGRSCDLARLAYARSLGWTSRWAGYRAAQVWYPGRYEFETFEALQRAREIAKEAVDYHKECLDDL